MRIGIVVAGMVVVTAASLAGCGAPANSPAPALPATSTSPVIDQSSSASPVPGTAEQTQTTTAGPTASSSRSDPVTALGGSGGLGVGDADLCQQTRESIVKLRQKNPNWTGRQEVDGVFGMLADSKGWRTASASEQTWAKAAIQAAISNGCTP